MTVQIVQALINQKDWDTLAATECLWFFGNYNSNVDSKKIYFDKDFIFQFFLNETLFKYHIDYFKDTLNMRDFSSINMYNNIIKRINELDIFGGKEWEIFIYKLKTIVFKQHSSNLAMDIMAHALSLDGKNAAFIQYIVNLTKEDFEKICAEIPKTHIHNKITSEQIKGLTQEEKIILRDRLTWDHNFRCLSDEPQVFLDIFGTPDNLFKFLLKEQKHNKGVYVKFGNALKDLPQQEYEAFLKKQIDNNITTDWLQDLLNYYKHHLDYSLETSLLEKILKLYHAKNPYSSKIFFNFISNISWDDIKKYNNIIGMTILVQRKGITIDEIIEIKGLQKINLSSFYFMTDDEIAKYPNFVEPHGVSVLPDVYISEGTWEILLKEWDSQVKYNPDLQDFETIVRNLRSYNFTLKNLKYLYEKTKPSNQDVLETLLYYVDKHKSEVFELKNINKLNRLFEKYK